GPLNLYDLYLSIDPTCITPYEFIPIYHNNKYYLSKIKYYKSLLRSFFFLGRIVSSMIEPTTSPTEMIILPIKSNILITILFCYSYSKIMNTFIIIPLLLNNKN